MIIMSFQFLGKSSARRISEFGGFSRGQGNLRQLNLPPKLTYRCQYNTHPVVTFYTMSTHVAKSIGPLFSLRH
jgi:hypothetical protein